MLLKIFGLILLLVLMVVISFCLPKLSELAQKIDNGDEDTSLNARHLS